MLRYLVDPCRCLRLSRGSDTAPSTIQLANMCPSRALGFPMPDVCCSTPFRTQPVDSSQGIPSEIP